MEKLDLSKLHKSYFKAKTSPEIVTFKSNQFLSIIGKGDPSGSAFAADVQALYSVAYAIKFSCKEINKDFKVSSLEGLWSFDEKKYAGIAMEDAPVKIPRSEWDYTLLVMMPDFVTKKMVAKAMESKSVTGVQLTEITEGKCVQILHVGPFHEEPASLKKLMEFSDSHKFQRNGRHHEIYLSDFRKTAPDKLKTILREPVK